MLGSGCASTRPRKPIWAQDHRSRSGSQQAASVTHPEPGWHWDSTVLFHQAPLPKRRTPDGLTFPKVPPKADGRLKAQTLTGGMTNGPPAAPPRPACTGSWRTWEARHPDTQGVSNRTASSAHPAPHKAGKGELLWSPGTPTPRSRLLEQGPGQDSSPRLSSYKKVTVLSPGKSLSFTFEYLNV